MVEIKKGGMTFQSKEKLRNYVKYVLNNQDLDKMLEGKWLIGKCYQSKIDIIWR